MSLTDRSIRLTPAQALDIVVGGVLVFLLIATLDRAFAMIFILNFSTDGPNATVALSLLLLTGLIYPLALSRFFPPSRRVTVGSAIAAAVAGAASLLPQATFAALTAILFHAAAAPLLFALVASLGARFALAGALGVLLNAAGRGVLDTAPFYGSWVGIGLLIAAFIAFAALAVVRGRVTAPGDAVSGARVTPVIVFVYAHYAFLGSVAVLSMWFPRDPVQVAAGLAVGVLVAVLLILRGRAVAQSSAIAWSAALAIAAVDLVYTNALGVIPVFVAAAASVMLLQLSLTPAEGRSAPTPARIGGRLAIVQLACVLLLFLEVSAGNWAFMPGPVGALTRGQAPLFLLALALMIPVVAFVSTGTRGGVVIAPGDAPKPSFSANHAVVALVLVAAIVAAGTTVAYEARVPTAAAQDVPFRVLTYNIHQYYSEGKTGLVNLAHVRDVIRDSGAAIVGLQESEGGRITSGKVDGVRWLAHELGMFAYHGPPTSAQVYGVSLLSKWPITTTSWVKLPMLESIERVAIIAEVDAPGGPLTVIVTHFSTEPFVTDRAAQASRIVALAEPFSRAIVMGDFNTPPLPNDVAYAVLANAFTDAWLAAPDTDPAGGISNPFDDPVARIDYIWLKGAWTVSHAEVVGSARASDHFGVLATLAPAP